MTDATIVAPSYALRDIYWRGLATLTAYHVLGIVGLAYIIFGIFDLLGASHVMEVTLYGVTLGPWWPTLIFAVAYFFLCHFSISIGAHRLYAHLIKVEFEASVHYALCILFSGTWQGPIIWWSGKHRRHHSKADTVEDPHSRVLGGFFHAHMGWLITKVGVSSPGKRDIHHFLKRRLGKYRPVWWQSANYDWLAPLMTFGVPTIVCSFWGDPLGGLLVAGGFRLVCQWHATWAINSVTHKGEPDEDGTAQNVWWLIPLAVGEGYHKEHHARPMEWRFGKYDPSAFVIMFLVWCRLGRFIEANA